MGQLRSSADLSQALLISAGPTHVSVSAGGWLRMMANLDWSRGWSLDDWGWNHLHVYHCQAVSWGNVGCVSSPSRLSQVCSHGGWAEFQKKGMETCEVSWDLGSDFAQCHSFCCPKVMRSAQNQGGQTTSISFFNVSNFTFIEIKLTWSYITFRCRMILI